MQHHYAHVNGVKLHYVTAGTGPLLILLHGFPEFWYGWKNQIPVLAQRYRVVAPDMRGYNLSDKPSKVTDYSIPILAKDVAELIKALGEKEAVVIGHDWGAAVAWAVAAYHPDVVSKLAILNVPHPAIMQKALMRFNWAQIKRSWYIFFFQLPMLPERIVGKRRFFERTFGAMKPAGRPCSISSSDIDKYVEAYQKPDAVWGPLSYYRAMVRQSLFGKLPPMPKIQAPVLMLWGEQDKALGKELTYNTDHYCAGEFNIYYEPGSGHFLQHDNPQWVNEHLIRFIDGR